MSISLNMILLGFLGGVAAVASNPSPFFAALGLVVVAVTGCWMIVAHGGTFLSVVVLLIYLGGMLVVFAYACSFSAESHPEGWETTDSKVLLLFYGVILAVSGLYFIVPQAGFSWAASDEGACCSVWRGDHEGVAHLYEGGGLMLLVAAWALLLTLFAVMEISRGGSRGVLRV